MGVAGLNLGSRPELNLANEILQAIPRQIRQINEMYSAITGYGRSQY